MAEKAVRMLKPVDPALFLSGLRKRSLRIDLVPA
jgi:hypothetical protein